MVQTKKYSLGTYQKYRAALARVEGINLESGYENANSKREWLRIFGIEKVRGRPVGEISPRMASRRVREIVGRIERYCERYREEYEGDPGKPEEEWIFGEQLELVFH